MREPGTEIHGRFTLVRLLGTGLGGETWLARDRSGQEMAIKLIMGESSQAHSDLLREAHVLQSIVHPHIVRYRGIVDLPGEEHTCLFMDYVPGGDLQDYLRKRKPDGYAPRTAAKLLLQVLEAIDGLHEAGVMHRDLKPKNILVSSLITDGLPTLLVADFGIAKQTAGGKSGETRAVGTPGYMAPEQYRSRTLSFAVDLHALGGVGWFLLTGDHPPDAGNLTPIHERRSEASSGRERALWDLICRLRHPNASSRCSLVESRNLLESIIATGQWTEDQTVSDSSTVDWSTLEDDDPGATLNLDYLPDTSPQPMASEAPAVESIGAPIPPAPTLEPSSTQEHAPVMMPAGYRAVPSWVLVVGGVLGGIGLVLGAARLWVVMNRVDPVEPPVLVSPQPDVPEPVAVEPVVPEPGATDTPEPATPEPSGTTDEGSTTDPGTDGGSVPVDDPERDGAVEPDGGGSRDENPEGAGEPPEAAERMRYVNLYSHWGYRDDQRVYLNGKPVGKSLCSPPSCRGSLILRRYPVPPGRQVIRCDTDDGQGMDVEVAQEPPYDMWCG